MIEGDTTLALAHSEAQSRYDDDAIGTTATPEGDGYRLTGKKTWVLNGHHADHRAIAAAETSARLAGRRGGEGVPTGALVLRR